MTLNAPMSINEMVYESMVKNLKRTQFLAACLAKLLEKPPSTYADEGPAAGWVESVDKMAQELAAELGQSNGIGTALRIVTELGTRAAECQNFIEENQLQDPERLSWFITLDFAQRAAENIHKIDADRLSVCAELQHLQAKYVRETAARDEEIVRLREELNRQPRRFKTIG